ncbi:MAG: response regulator transcription factor [Acidobacteria bacterium]|nr:response regulator transcription factor [Acidobacteriota bacterium]
MTETGTKSPIRALVVDDSPWARDALCLWLETRTDVEIVGTAVNGCQALELIEALQPDLILMDIQMPELNGLEATRRLRERRSPAKIIMITIHDNPEMEVRCKENGADGFVPKNRLTERLPAEINRVVGKL